MIQVSVLFCLVSVAFAHPYDSSRYFDDWVAAPVQLIENSQSYSQPQTQDEGSSRPTRAIEYPAESENVQPVPEVTYIELDENTVRNARSLLSGQSINSNMEYEIPLNQQVFNGQIPQVSRISYTSPQMEQSTQNYRPRSFSFDTLPFTSSVENPVFNMPPAVNPRASSEDFLKDCLLKELNEPSNKPAAESKGPRMIGFYYMNIQRFPVKQVVDDSAFDLKPVKNQGIEELDRGQVNGDEMMRQLQHLLQHQISKFVHHQQQEHSLFQELTQPQNDKKIIPQESASKKSDVLGKEEKKFLVERLHQEEQWLEDSLKHIRGFLNELQPDDVTSTTNSASPAAVSDLNNANDGIKHIITTSTEGSGELTSVSPTESSPAALNGSQPKETA